MTTRTALYLLVVVAAVTALLSARSAERQPGGSADLAHVAPGARLAGRVIRAVDGDTVKVAVGAAAVTVRYIGIDTPESVKPGVPVQCYAKAASHRNADLVTGKDVTL